MIEAIAIPILTKAIDFLFDESKKILEERRKRREKFDVREKSNDGIQTKNGSTMPLPHEQTISNRSDALSFLIEESAWKEKESEINNLLELLEIQRKNYNLHAKQYAYYGEADVPQRIIHSIDNDEKEIMKTSKKLQDALSNVYKAKVSAVEETEFND